MEITQQLPQRSLFITMIGDTKILTKIDYLTESYIQGAIIYPYDEVVFEYFTDKEYLNKPYNFSKVREIIHNNFLMYAELVKQRQKILKESAGIPRGRMSAVSGMYWGAQISAFSSNYAKQLEETFNQEYFNNRVRERLQQSIRKVLSDKEFPFKIHTPVEYEKIFCSAIAHYDNVVDIDSKTNFNNKLQGWKKFL